VVRFADTILWGNHATNGHELTVAGGVPNLLWSDLEGGLADILALDR
jgi:hypothetical protein